MQEFMEKSTNLVLALQQEVGELKEDTLLNASHIQLIKESHKDKLNDLNSSMSKLNETTGELVNGLEEELTQTQTNNYIEFLKILLNEDFKALQSEMLEQAKRELLNAKSQKNKKQENIIISFIKAISPALSMASFILLIVICFKFKLFGALFQ